MADNVEWMFSVREQPWHKQGIVVPDVLTAEEALVAGGLDWEVQKKPVFVRLGDKRIVVPDYFATVRSSDGHPLGVVKNYYVPLQNKDAFDWFDKVVESKEAKYETAGSLKMGKRVFITAKISNTNVMVAGKDLVEPYFLLTNSHDGTAPVTAAVVMVRVVCENTLNMALGSAYSTWRIRHTKTMGDKMAEAQRALGLAKKYTEQFQLTANNLCAADISSFDFQKILEDVSFPLRAIENVIALFNNAPNLEEVRGTKWAAYNAVAEWYDWGRNPRTSDAHVATVLYGGEIKNVVLTALSAN